MDQDSLEPLQKNEARCSKCNLIIPFTFKKGKEYTCPSFSIVDGNRVCYHCMHPEDYVRHEKKANKD